MSFEIARSGLNAVSGSLEAISNNIANSGTYGFKSSRANFSAMYSGSHASGASVSSMTQNLGMTGGLFSTGRGMDAMIQGRGYFAVRDASGLQTFTRVGIFNVDKDGYVVDASGRNVQGYAALLDASGRVIEDGGVGALGDLKINVGQIGAQATDKLSFNGNLSADWATPAVATFDKDDPRSYNYSETSVLYDSQGAKHTLTQYFVKTGTNAITAHYSFDGAAPSGTQAITFNADGTLATPTAAFALPTVTPAGVDPITVSMDYSGTVQFAGDTSIRKNEANGNAAGTLINTAISEDGSIVATYSNGKKQTVGTLALATFANENALVALSDTSWEANAATGTALFSRPGTAQASKLSVAAIEQSNVDMTGELVNLMAAQRNYQANTKVISAEEQMMQALMQAV